jgi:hypothetical protein
MKTSMSYLKNIKGFEKKIPETYSPQRCPPRGPLQEASFSRETHDMHPGAVHHSLKWCPCHLVEWWGASTQLSSVGAVEMGTPTVALQALHVSLKSMIIA